MIANLYDLLAALVQDDNRLSEDDAQDAQEVIDAARTAGTLGAP